LAFMNSSLPMQRSRGDKRKLASGTAEDRVFHKLLCQHERETRENLREPKSPKPVAAESGKRAGARSSADAAAVAKGEERASKPSVAVGRSSAAKAAETARESEVTRLLGNCAGLQDAQFLIRALRRR